MITLDDIINASFARAGRSGYNTEDVDDFLDSVRESYEELLHKLKEQTENYEELKKENDQLLEKMDVLVDAVEEYRSEENEIKNALISAHKVADASVRDAKQRADELLQKASDKADLLVREATERSERMIHDAKREAADKIKSVEMDVEAKKRELEIIQEEVSDFRASLIEKYREHLTLINDLPVRQESTPEEVAKEEAPVFAERPKPNAAFLKESFPAPKPEPPAYEPKPPVQEAVSPQAAAPYVAPAVVPQPTPQPQQPNLFENYPQQEEAVETAYTQGKPRDLRYDVLNFGEEYDITEDDGEEDSDDRPRFFRKRKNKKY